MSANIEPLSAAVGAAPARSLAQWWSGLTKARPGSLYWIARLISLAVVLTAWQIEGARLNPIFLSTPTKIITALGTMIVNGEILEALKISSMGMLIGFGLAVIVGIPFGIFMGRSRLFEAIVDPYVNALFVTPRIALIPLILIWFGIGFEAQIVMIFMSAVFPIVIASYSGVKSIGANFVDTARSFCADERHMFWEVILPASVPFMMTGLRLGLGHAVIGVVVAQMFLALTGMGKLLVNYGNFFKTDYVLATVIVISLFGVLLTEGMKRVESHFAHWKESERAFV